MTTNRQFARDFTNTKSNSKKKNDMKPLFFTFLGTFIVFFFAFTVLLPILTPQVDIPATTTEHSLNSITSNDFKGRLDPRLNEIEQEENAPAAPKLKMETPNAQTQQDQSGLDEQVTDQGISSELQEPQDNMDDGYNNNIQSPGNTQKPNVSAKKTAPKPIKSNSANIPPRPQPSRYTAETARPVSMAKVVLGSYATPMQARLVSDTLIEMDLNVAPFIKEKDGRYILQVGSFSDPAKADGLVQELRSKSFNAKVVYE